MDEIAREQLESLLKEFEPLLGLKLNWLSIPEAALLGFEPSQIAVIVNTLVDAALPQIELLATDEENRTKLKEVGLLKARGIIGERESYPDYIHKSGYRVELKGLFIDNPELNFKRPPTRREPSARIKENITIDVVNSAKDVLMLAAIQLHEVNKIAIPTIVDIGLFSMIECIRARDKRLIDGGGRWHNGVPQVIKFKSLHKLQKGELLTDSDYERDTNFGKLKRIPYLPLQAFLRKHKTI